MLLIFINSETIAYGAREPEGSPREGNKGFGGVIEIWNLKVEKVMPGMKGFNGGSSSGRDWA